MRIAIAVLMLLASLSPAFASMSESKSWFDQLGADERLEVQANLSLLGHYTYLMDGEFGTGTYQALVAFQRRLGLPETGVLDPAEHGILIRLGTQVHSDLGMDFVRDQEAQATLLVPLGLLTVLAPAENGNSFATPDGEITLNTFRRPLSETGFRPLFEQMTAPGPDRDVTYSNFSNARFVVTGTAAGRSFHTMVQNAETDSVGYTLSWTPTHDERAAILSIVIASHFTPFRFQPPPGTDGKIGEVVASVEKVGVFRLPPQRPDVIVLNGEVTLTLADDFRRALNARPDASVLLLNSPGGYVNNALQVAHEVRRRGMSTLVADGMGCYSACSYIYFAGKQRTVEGELGVHQISAQVADLVMAQTTLSDVLDALSEFGVRQPIISVMLRTPPEEMYVFSPNEIGELGINLGDRVVVADVADLLQVGGNVPEFIPPDPPDPTTGGVAWVEMAVRGTEEDARESLEYATERWGSLLEDGAPTIAMVEVGSGTQYRVRAPARSIERASALCAAIKSAGGGCFVTRG